MSLHTCAGRRIIELGRNMCACLDGKNLHDLEYLITLTVTRSNEEPERTDEFERRLLDFIMALAACRHDKREHIDSLIARYYIEDAVLSRKQEAAVKLLELKPEPGWPMWKHSIKEFWKSRDYKNTWKDRLKNCIVLITVMHLLACLLIPEIREWTLDIIVRCNEDYFIDYFNSMAEWYNSIPRQESSEPLIQYLCNL